MSFSSPVIASPPRISVIVPAFNSENYIGRCLRSLLQPLPSSLYDIIVPNDGSNDKTAYALSQFVNPWNSVVKTITNNTNLGLPSALNLGIKASESKYVVRVDSDDFVSQHFLTFLYHYLNMNEGCSSVSCDYVEVDEFENEIRRVDAQKEPIGCAIAFRKETLLEIGLYNEDFHIHEERELRHRYEQCFTIDHLPMPLYRYRKHENNMTNDKLKSNVYEKRLQNHISCDQTV